MTARIPIKDYVDVVTKGLQDEIDRRFAAFYRQVDQAREAMEFRLNGMNEFRQSLADVTGQMVQRSLLDHFLEEIASTHLRFQKQIDTINTSLAQSRGRQAAYTSGIAVLISVVSVVLYALTLVR